MTLTWVICGAGRLVGKTHLAQGLCAVLPNAIYAKQGCGTKRAGKPENFFRTEAEVAAFIEACRPTHEHIIVESNELACRGQGDIVIFVDGIPGKTDYRADVELLRSRSQLHTTPDSSASDWREVLERKLPSAALCSAVCDLLAAQQRYARKASPAIREVEPLRVSTADGTAVRDPGQVVIEELVTVMVEGVGNFALMCTPCDVEALAVGFVYSEGLISSIDDVVACSYRSDQGTVGLRLDNPGEPVSVRNLIVTSSCGMCGSRNVEQLLAGGVASGDSLRVPATLLRAVTEEMHARQAVFARTGGTHAAGVFSADGKLLALGEDIGRHNALDKAVGKCLMRGLSLAGCGAVLSGRVSLELVAKAVRAGLEMLVAVSAPSSLAIQVAERCNITLCGFVRGERATAYTHPRRILSA